MPSAAASYCRRLAKDLVIALNPEQGIHHRTGLVLNDGTEQLAKVLNDAHIPSSPYAPRHEDVAEETVGKDCVLLLASGLSEIVPS